MLTVSTERRVSGYRQTFQFDYLRLYNIVPKFLNLISGPLRGSLLAQPKAALRERRSDDFSWLTDLESKYLNIIFLFPRRSQVFLNICKNYRSRRDIS